MSAMRRRLPVFAAAAWALLLTSAPAAAAPRSFTIVIGKMKFGALPAMVHAGDTIVWDNRDMFRHSATAKGAFDIDLPAGLVYVRKGWDQEEGEIEPKSEAGNRVIPLLAILRRFLEDHLERTGRSGEDRIFGREDREAFYPSTVEYRAKRAWRNHNKVEREKAEAEDREPDLLTVLTFP